MAQLYAGAQLERPPKPGYAEKLPFVELVFPTTRPRANSLEKWRRSMASGFEVALVAPRNCLVDGETPYRSGNLLDAGLAWLEEARTALNAHLVLPNYGLTTSKRDRARLGEVAERLRRNGTGELIWAPGGLWEAEQAYPFAEALGVRCAIDPLENIPPATDFLYARLAAIGTRKRFSEGVLEEALDSVLESGAAQIFIAIASPRAIHEATNLVRISQ